MSFSCTREPQARPPAIFSQTVEPFRVMVLDKHRRPVALGTVRARHSLGGSLTGYYVELDDGTRMSAAPDQIGAPENVIAPPAAIWATPRAPSPLGAA